MFVGSRNAKKTIEACACVSSKAFKLSKSDNGEPTWNQVAYEGEWHGHSAGEFQFTKEIFETLIANFERREDDIPVTYGHPDGATGAHHGAAGWIEALKIDTDDKGRVALFAQIKWTQRAASMIEDDELRYCSVVVGFESYDEVTGEPIGPELFEVGAVLSAFLDGMQPLQLWRSSPKRNRAASRKTTKGAVMDAQAIRAKLTELAQVLNMDPAALEGDDGYYEVLNRIDALIRAADLAQVIDSTVGDAPAAAAGRALNKLHKAVACAVDIDQIKSALDQLAGSEPTPEQVKQIIEGALLQQAAVGGDEPTEEPTEEEPQVAASDTPEVAAEDDPEPATPSIADRFAEALGMSTADVAALFETHFEEIVSILSGTNSEAPSTSAMSKIAARASELGRKLNETKTELAKLKAEHEKDRLELKLSQAVSAGHITDDEIDYFRELGVEAPNLFAKQLSARAESPPVPTKPKVRISPPKIVDDEQGGELTPRDDTERQIVKMLGRRPSKQLVESALRGHREKQASA